MRKVKLCVLFLVFFIVSILVFHPVQSKDATETQLEKCVTDCNDIEKIDYEAVLIEESIDFQKMNRVAVAERKAELKKEKLEKDELKKEELMKEKLNKEKLAKLEKKKGQQPVVASRSQGYQSNYKATFYTSSCKGCTGQSASGEWVNKSIYYEGYRIVAASPNIAFYTKLRITFADGSKMDVIVLDRGSDIRGKRLDILVESKEEAYRLGRQQVKVEIIQ